MAMATSILAGVGFPFQPSFDGGDVCRLQSSEQKGAKGAFSHCIKLYLITAINYERPTTEASRQICAEKWKFRAGRGATRFNSFNLNQR